MWLFSMSKLSVFVVILGFFSEQSFFSVAHMLQNSVYDKGRSNKKLLTEQNHCRFTACGLLLSIAVSHFRINTWEAHKFNNLNINMRIDRSMYCPAVPLRDNRPEWMVTFWGLSQRARVVHPRLLPLKGIAWPWINLCIKPVYWGRRIIL